jgi:hypothetical protein
MATNVFLGTELKLNINIEPIGAVTMEDYDFEVEVYCSAKKVIVIPKSEAIKVDSNNYIVLVDTNVVGAGELKCKITAHIPDGDFADRGRTEVVVCTTNITITKGL